MKERCGIPKRAAQRNAQMAFDNGLNHENTKGKLRKYIDSKESTTEYTNIRVWNGYVYVFMGEALLTVYPVPKKYEKRELSMRRRAMAEALEI